MATPQTDFEKRLERIDQLVQTIEAAPDPGLRSTAQELIQTLMELHAAGLERTLTMVQQSGAGTHLIQQLALDPLVSGLMLLHGLHPVDLETRVLEALEKARPYLMSHGGNVELAGVDENGVVRLRMKGTCHGCPSSSLTLKSTIEEAIRAAAPDVTEIMILDETVTTPAQRPLVVLEGAGALPGPATGRSGMES